MRRPPSCLVRSETEFADGWEKGSKTLADALLDNAGQHPPLARWVLTRGRTKVC
jgi:hypothetical protein